MDPTMKSFSLVYTMYKCVFVYCCVLKLFVAIQTVVLMETKKHPKVWQTNQKKTLWSILESIVYQAGASPFCYKQQCLCVPRTEMYI